MSEQKLKTRRLYVELTYTEEDCPTSQDAADALYEALEAGLEDIEGLSVNVEPSNDDQSLPEGITESTRMIQVYVNCMRAHAENNDILPVIEPGLHQVEIGAADLNATMRVLEHLRKEGAQGLIKDMGEGMQFGVVTSKNIHRLPTPLLHALAHRIAHETNMPDCSFHESFSREELIEWIKQHAENMGGTPVLN